MWSPPTTANAWKFQQKVLAMVTDRRLTLRNTQQFQGNGPVTKKGGWGVESRCAKSAGETRFDTVKTPPNDAENVGIRSQNFANPTNLIKSRREMTAK